MSENEKMQEPEFMIRVTHYRVVKKEEEGLFLSPEVRKIYFADMTGEAVDPHFERFAPEREKQEELMVGMLQAMTDAMSVGIELECMTVCATPVGPGVVDLELLFADDKDKVVEGRLKLTECKEHKHEWWAVREWTGEKQDEKVMEKEN